MSKLHGFAPIIVILIVVGLLAIFGSGYYIYQKSQNAHESTGQQTKCAQEGKFTSGGKLAYYYSCCEGLKEFDTCPSCPPDKGYLCFNPVKGIPACKATGTVSEGWYYSESGSLLMNGKCSK